MFQTGKLDRFISQNPVLVGYYQRLGKDDLISKLALAKMQKVGASRGQPDAFIFHSPSKVTGAIFPKSFSSEQFPRLFATGFARKLLFDWIPFHWM